MIWFIFWILSATTNTGNCLRPVVSHIMDHTSQYAQQFGSLWNVEKYWEIYIPYNITVYQEEVSMLYESAAKFMQEYNHIEYKFAHPHENNIRNQLETFKTELKLNLAEISLRHDQIMSHFPKTRGKRMVPTLYRIAKKVFGEFTYNEQNLFEIEMEKFNKDNKLFLDMTKTHTTIFKNIASTLNESISKNEIAMGKFSYDLQSLLTGFNLLLKTDPKTQKRHDYFETNLFGPAGTLKRNTDVFVKQITYEQNNLIAYIEAAARGILHPTVIKGEILTGKIKTITAHFLNEFLYPGEFLSVSTWQYLDFLSVKLEFEEGVMVFHVTVPLVGRIPFELVKMYTIPFTVNGKTLLMDQSSNILGRTNLTIDHILVDEKLLSSCRQVDRHYICDKNLAKSSNSCESEMFKGKTNGLCKLNEYIPGFFIKKLQNENAYLFSTGKETIDIACETGEFYKQQLDFKGLIQISKFCHLERGGRKITDLDLKLVEVQKKRANHWEIMAFVITPFFAAGMVLVVIFCRFQESRNNENFRVSASVTSRSTLTLDRSTELQV